MMTDQYRMAVALHLSWTALNLNSPTQPMPIPETLRTVRMSVRQTSLQSLSV